jgi:branched-chain amino acid transport system permease protein
MVLGVLLCLLWAPAAGAQEPGPTDTAPAGAPTDTTPAGESTPTAPSATPAPPTGGVPRVVATLTVDGEPLEGVVMIVSLDGDEIGTAESDADGFVAVEVPGPGQYDVTLDEDSFPDDVAFDPEARTELAPRVQAAGDRSIVFRLVVGDGSESAPAGASSSSFDRIVSLVASGTRFGLVIALAAVGLSLIFGTTGLTNFAHGELIAFGAIVTWFLNSNGGGFGIPLVFAAIGGVAAAALFGAGFELGVYRPLRRRGMPIVSQMVVSIGLALTFRYVFSIWFGSSSQQYSQYAAQAPTIDIGPFLLRPKDVVMAIIAAIVLVAVGLFLQRARLGTAIRAVSDNKDLSIASGIDDKRVVLTVWLMAGALAGLSGVMLGSSEFIGWNMGQRVLLITFAAVLLGGLGTTFGAMVGGLFVGIVSDVSTYWLDADLKIVVALATLVAVLLIRPQGVFGVKARTA